MAPPPPPLRDLFMAFAKLGVTSFGGGLTGWMMQECVRRRGWVTEEEFLTGLAMAQALPGVNVVNLPLWIGYRLAGNAGAIVAALGVIIPPMIIVTIMAATYGWLQRFNATHLALEGAAAAAIGLSLSMGLRAARRQIRQLAPALVLVAVFTGVGLLKLPLLLVVALAAPDQRGPVLPREQDVMRDNPLLTLLMIFAPLSLLSVGGGQAVLPEIHRQVVLAHGWLTEQTFVADFAISKMAPGPTSLIVTLIGWQVAGLAGAAISTVAIFVPSSLLVLGLARVWARYRGAPWQIAVERGLAPVAAGLILAGSLTLFRAATGGWLAWVVAIVATVVIAMTELNPLLVIGGGAAVFLVLGS